MSDFNMLEHGRELMNMSYKDDKKKEVRQKKIIQWIENSHFVSLDEIAQRFNITTQTARRDIYDLAQKGSVRKLHGGASALAMLDTDTYRQRRIDNNIQKSSIAQIVSNIIPDNSSIFLDTGTTCEAVANYLTSKNNLRIITYSLRSAGIISEKTDFTLAIPGGIVRPFDGSILPHNANEFINRFKFDFAIISVSGIDKDGDLCDDDQNEVTIVSSAIQLSKKVILAVDSSKFGKSAMVKLGSLDDIDILVTDKIPDDEFMQSANYTNIQIFT
ncbi:DeoR/GlpR family DNA-binding transcription regulator [Brucella sp. TWI432]